jgi:hypothetical protein
MSAVASDTTDTKPVLFVTGCQKYRQYVDAALIRFANPAWHIVGIVGSAAEEATATATTATRVGDIVTLPVPDTYEALPTKIHAAFSWIAANYPNTVGIFKTDDDIVFGDMAHLARAIALCEARPYWGLFVGNCRENPVNQARIQMRFDDKTLQPRHQAAIYCYGHGYWVSAAALPHILAAGDEFRASYLEDVCVGAVLNRAGIVPARVALPYSELERTPELLSAK